MCAILMLLLCLVVSQTAVDLRSVQGIYTGNNPIAPYTGDEPFRFDGMLNADAGEFCLSMTQKGAEKPQCVCFALGAELRSMCCTTTTIRLACAS